MTSNALALDAAARLGRIPPDMTAHQRDELHDRTQRTRGPGIAIVVCSVCRRTSVINADDRPLELLAMMDRGWWFEKGKARCPRCPKPIQ